MLCFSLFSYFSSLASYSECDCISLKANPLLIHNLNLRINNINDFNNSYNFINDGNSIFKLNINNKDFYIADFLDTEF